MTTMERIKGYMDYKNIPIATFERNVGMSNNSFGKTLKSGGSIGLDKLEKILSVYPDLSAEWLLRGVGDMILDDKEQIGGERNKYFVLCKLLLENRQRDNELFSELAKLMSKD